MEVAVWDTYVTKKDGRIMHFDIIVPSNVKDENIIYNFGKEYLKSKNQEGQALTASECKFCHVQSIKPKREEEIKQKGYSIYEMENCD
ncbi:MAG: DUF2024 family protein [Bacteroidetes bacterium]|nr:DUF2024 family protein [Bacteroidota bacterium]